MKVLVNQLRLNPQVVLYKERNKLIEIMELVKHFPVRFALLKVEFAKQVLTDGRPDSINKL